MHGPTSKLVCMTKDVLSWYANLESENMYGPTFSFYVE
jgi:hypothetical protein